MTEPLFDRAVVFADIHFGLKNNSPAHNQDCLDFLDWMTALAKERNIATCIFLGDWHHYRNTVHVSTLDHSIRGFRKLNEAFARTWLITGNHDEYYKNSRELNSLPFDNYPNITIVNEPLLRNDAALVPWLTPGDSIDDIAAMQCRYMFGHFEFAGFKMNAGKVVSAGGRDPDAFRGPEHVFSGHFHIRQRIGNIHYVGSPFPHSYADAWDDRRGCMTLDWGGEPEFHNWRAGPKYRTSSLGGIASDPDGLLAPKTHVRAALPLDVGYEDAAFVKEVLVRHYGLRELAFVTAEEETEALDPAAPDADIMTVDDFVIHEIRHTMAESEVFDKERLIDMYLEL